MTSEVKMRMPATVMKLAVQADILDAEKFVEGTGV